MKKFLVAGIAAAALCGAPALSADIPTKAPAPAYVGKGPVGGFSWNGCYIGGNVGGAWANKRATITRDGVDPVNAPIGSLTADGWAYGGQIGCDYQFNNNWVVGIRGMWDGSSMSGSNQNPNPFVTPLTDHVKIGSFGTVVGKLGYLLNPTLQLYGLAGVAWVHDHYFWTTFVVAGNQTRTGYDVGVGISWMFARNWDI